MGGGRRTPRCRGGRPFCRTPSIGVSGFVPVWARSSFSSSCVVVRAWCLEFGGAATGGGAVRARVVRAAHSAACLRVLLSQCAKQASGQRPFRLFWPL